MQWSSKIILIWMQWCSKIILIWMQWSSKITLIWMQWSSKIIFSLRLSWLKQALFFGLQMIFFSVTNRWQNTTLPRQLKTTSLSSSCLFSILLVQYTTVHTSVDLKLCSTLFWKGTSRLHTTNLTGEAVSSSLGNVCVFWRCVVSEWVCSLNYALCEVV